MSLVNEHETTSTALSAANDMLISDELLNMFQTICYGFLCQLINVFGIVSNIINMICLIEQGFKDAINVSLVGLAVSDFGCLVTMVWVCICYTPQFQEADLPFDPIDGSYLSVGIPHLMFTRATSSITALIMLERCLCVTMPLKVRNIFTPRAVSIIIGFIYIVLIASIAPIYFVSRYSMVFNQERNGTILGIVFTDNRELVEHISFSITNVFVPFASLIIITVCMMVLAISLKRQAQWRCKSSVSTSVDTKTDRDKKLAKMVVTISTLFVVSFTPSGAIFIGMMLVSGFSYGGEYEKLVIFCYTFATVLESLNSSSNIFIYYSMSSRYRACFQQLVSRKSLCISSK